jgi:hypothetical protein
MDASVTGVDHEALIHFLTDLLLLPIADQRQPAICWLKELNKFKQLRLSRTRRALLAHWAVPPRAAIALTAHVDTLKRL